MAPGREANAVEIAALASPTLAPIPEITDWTKANPDLNADVTEVHAL
jgi:hypothetical protein